MSGVVIVDSQPGIDKSDSGEFIEYKSKRKEKEQKLKEREEQKKKERKERAARKKEQKREPFKSIKPNTTVQVSTVPVVTTPPIVTTTTLSNINSTPILETQTNTSVPWVMPAITPISFTQILKEQTESKNEKEIPTIIQQNEKEKVIQSNESIPMSIPDNKTVTKTPNNSQSKSKVKKLW